MKKKGGGRVTKKIERREKEENKSKERRGKFEIKQLKIQSKLHLLPLGFTLSLSRNRADPKLSLSLFLPLGQPPQLQLPPLQPAQPLSSSPSPLSLSASKSSIILRQG